MPVRATPEQLAAARAARAAYRQGVAEPTSGVAPGLTQANLIAVPADWAFETLLFAQRNPKPCPVLEVIEQGQVASALAPGSDIRTDIGRYRIWRDGELVSEQTDARDAWAEHPDLVAFLIGCSFTFEAGLAEAGIPIRHQELARNVPMYRTTVPCAPAGRLRGEMVVSMRPIPAGRVADAVRISGRTPAVHGAPVHIGDPASLGIADLSRPDFGDPPEVREGEVPVFWACGVTPQAAIMASKPPFAVTHAPGYMFVTDVPDAEYVV
ncbi:MULTISPECIES: putative hydro-lyase [Microbacterium]|uniref:putative hydro-lyase n=1 Tax=Microbacterium TaxID=33882 RepID=UPI00217D2981|nr:MULTISPECIES: putative hydro-lyase [Microbacterium]UWF77672.1 putative hydro-lyase [Microbacterium neungamense]WCM55841.1 putative hydro-lyase [Microbacterium sp. EF45047]